MLVPYLIAIGLALVANMATQIPSVVITLRLVLYIDSPTS